MREVRGGGGKGKGKGKKKGGGGYEHILHTTPQTRLDRLRIPSKHPHDRGPAQTREDRPRVS